MILDRASGTISHKHIADFPDLLKTGDVLVINNSKVFKARLLGLIKRVGYVSGRAELFLLRPVKNGLWTALCKPAKKFVVGYKNVMHAYQTAIDQNYRFYSFGDGMWIG